MLWHSTRKPRYYPSRFVEPSSAPDKTFWCVFVRPRPAWHGELAGRLPVSLRKTNDTVMKAPRHCNCRLVADCQCTCLCKAHMHATLPLRSVCPWFAQSALGLTWVKSLPGEVIILQSLSRILLTWRSYLTAQAQFRWTSVVSLCSRHCQSPTTSALTNAMPPKRWTFWTTGFWMRRRRWIQTSTSLRGCQDERVVLREVLSTLCKLIRSSTSENEFTYYGISMINQQTMTTPWACCNGRVGPKKREGARGTLFCTFDKIDTVLLKETLG